MRFQIGQHLRSVESGLLISLPRIDGVAPGLRLQFFHRLTQGTIRNAIVRTQFDDHFWTQYIYQTHCKRHVAYPARCRHPKGKSKRNRMIYWIESRHNVSRGEELLRYTKASPVDKCER